MKKENECNCHVVLEISNLHSQGRARRAALARRPEFVFIPKGKAVLVVPVPEWDELAGIAKGAKTRNYRDRSDRV